MEQHDPHQPVPIFSNTLKWMAGGAVFGLLYHLVKNGGIAGADGVPLAEREEFDVDSIVQKFDARQETLHWAHPAAAMELHKRCLERSETEPEYNKRVLELATRWCDIQRRCLRVGVCPLLSMPRSVSGDVCGTDEMLSEAMDKIEDYLMDAEQLTDFDNKWSSSGRTLEI